MLHTVCKIASRAWRSWLNVFTRIEDPRFLAAFRIGIGLSVLIVVGSAVLSDVVDVVWLDRAHGGILSLGNGTPLVHFLGGPKPAVVWSVVAIAFFSGFLLMLGFWAKLCAFIALQTTLSLLDLNSYAPAGGAGLLLTNALWLLVFARSSTTWSLDCFLKTRRWSSTELIPAWPRYLAIVQILVCYFCTGIQKVSIHWLPGGDFSAMYYILQTPAWQRFDHTWLAWIFPLTQIGTATVWFWEVAAPLWGVSLWLSSTTHKPSVKRIADYTRWLFFTIGVFLHIMIYIFMDIGVFSWVSLSFYPCLLLTADLATKKRAHIDCG